MTKTFLPYGRQSIDDDDINAVADVLKGDWLTTGPTVAAFEEAFAKTVGAKHGVVVSSGTAALHLATLALGLGPGDAVAVPAVTFMASANAVRYVGADVVFTDVDPDTGLMREEDLRRALAGPKGDKIRAVFPVHLNGQVVNMAAIAAVAADHGLVVVDDGCHAIGTQCRSANGAVQAVGALDGSAMTAFSLHPVKTITMGEGGVITTDDDELARHLRSLRAHGIARNPSGFKNTKMSLDKNGDANPWYHEMVELGFNYRASDINCALGLSQLKKLDRFAKRRRAIMAQYDELLTTLEPRLVPVPRIDGCDPVLHLYAVLIDFDGVGKSRAQVMKRLSDRGVGTQVHYIPVAHQPYYQDLYGASDLPGADAYYSRCLSLPFFPDMTDANIEHVVSALTDVLAV